MSRGWSGWAAAAVLVAGVLAGCGGASEEAAETEVNVYTHRHYEADQTLYDAFEDETGITVNVIKAGADELIQRLQVEGERSPADLFVAVDVGRLARAAELGLFQPLGSETAHDRVAEHLRDPEDRWVGLTKRARVVVYHPDRVSADEITTYESLTDPKWKGRILVRSSSNIYNQSLLSAIIAGRGEEAAREWAAGIVANLARAPKGNDRDQVKAVVAGEGDIAIVNTYYLALLLNSENPEEARVGREVRIAFPDLAGRGTHVNVSGVGLAAHAPHPTAARRLVEYLLADAAQSTFTNLNYEYPVVGSAAPAPVVAEWGALREDTISLASLGEHHATAVKIFDEVGWR